MIVSWNWLKDYVDLTMPQAQLVERLSMAGLNHEGTTAVEQDWAIDLEVTSNRPDCLGHIGVAREIAVLWEQALRSPAVDLTATGPAIEELTEVTIECPQRCPRYTARVLRGVSVGPSPAWLVERLHTLGIASINNVVDVTNYVMMECGQPLHAFDFAKLAGPRIVVRAALPGERFFAINHQHYDLQPGMCVIADAQQAVALGGVMGGADTEVSSATTELLIEAADFAPLSIRTTARTLALHSPSSYRFERGVDPVGLDWASRRCCQLILQLAGGELAAGVLDIGQPIPPREPLVLRLAQLPRVLGIEIAPDQVQRILAALGCEVAPCGPTEIRATPPSWRADLTREIDLVEEVARIHGYDKIPEDVGVPMVPSHRRHDDRVLDGVRGVLVAAGLNEAMTASIVPAEWIGRFSPWTTHQPLQSSTPMLQGADRLRTSLVPSLLAVRQVNQSLGNSVIELFETARLYLPESGQLPREQWSLALTIGGDFFRLKGIIQAILDALRPAARMTVVDTDQPLFDPARGSARLELDGQLLGFVGELSEEGCKQFGLRSSATVAELDLSLLAATARLVPQHREQSPYPPIERDLNLVVEEPLRWATIATTVEQSAGEFLEQLSYQETYRDPQKDGIGKKRLLFSITLRSSQRTLTNEEADAIRENVVQACHQQHGAVLLGT